MFIAIRPGNCQISVKTVVQRLKLPELSVSAQFTQEVSFVLAGKADSLTIATAPGIVKKPSEIIRKFLLFRVFGLSKPN
jgi:hypothetical protein